MTLDSVQCQVGVMFTQEIKHAVYSEDEACCIFFFFLPWKQYLRNRLFVSRLLKKTDKQINIKYLALVRVCLYETCWHPLYVKI